MIKLGQTARFDGFGKSFTGKVSFVNQEGTMGGFEPEEDKSVELYFHKNFSNNRYYTASGNEVTLT